MISKFSKPVSSHEPPPPTWTWSQDPWANPPSFSQFSCACLQLQSWLMTGDCCLGQIQTHWTLIPPQPLSGYNGFAITITHFREKPHSDRLIHRKEAWNIFTYILYPTNMEQLLISLKFTFMNYHVTPKTRTSTWQFYPNGESLNLSHHHSISYK